MFQSEGNFKSSLNQQNIKVGDLIKSTADQAPLYMRPNMLSGAHCPAKGLFNQYKTTGRPSKMANSQVYKPPNTANYGRRPRAVNNMRVPKHP